jgi:hypothetical protein
MNIRELISTLTEIADKNPDLTNKPLSYIDRDNCWCEVKNVRLLDSYVDDDLLVDLGGEYMSKEEMDMPRYS